MVQYRIIMTDVNIALLSLQLFNLFHNVLGKSIII
jgi:hypothetical protein